MPDVTLHLGDCLEVLEGLPLGCADAVVTDPPAGIAFMGKTFDTFADREAFIAFLSAAMAECLRVLRPGAYGLVWALPRTSHWTGTALEDAGFEVRDRITHLFGQGFPKAKSCLKPAAEDWWLVRKPGPKVLPLGVDECRIPTATRDAAAMARCNSPGSGRLHPRERMYSGPAKGAGPLDVNAGRWPANVVLSHHSECNGTCHAECPVRLLDEQSGERHSYCSSQEIAEAASGKAFVNKGRQVYGLANENGQVFVRGRMYSDTGGASRFFYCPKSSRRDRGEGNTHPTVKSTALMSWLVKLVAREGETVLDPFAGSGSTGVACVQTGRRFVGVELDPQYHAIARRRVEEAQAQAPLFEDARA